VPYVRSITSGFPAPLDLIAQYDDLSTLAADLGFSSHSLNFVFCHNGR